MTTNNANPVQSAKDELSFWEHLDELRTAIIKILVVSIAFGLIAFFFREELFAIILAPKGDDFITYRLFAKVSELTGISADNFSVQLISTGLAQQFVIHMKTALCAGVLCASPYIIYQLFRFVSPALYTNERKYAVSLVCGGYVMFMVGLLLNYFLFFPLTFRFLGTYQVSDDVANMITLDSYMSTLLTMSISLGAVFEIPVLSWLFAKMGLLNADFMRHYRKHAIVIILVLAAVITPTSDIFTMSLVALPIWILYEISIQLISHCKPDKKEE